MTAIVLARRTVVMERILATVPLGLGVFVLILLLDALSVERGALGDDALRLWAGASTAAEGEVPVGRIVAAYPTLPFMATTLLTWLAPAGTPVLALLAAGLLALIAVMIFLLLQRSGLPAPAAFASSLLLALHPDLLRIAPSGPGDAFLALFLLVFCLTLYDLRSRSGTVEVMNVGLALLGLVFCHPMGAAFAFASVPLLAFVVQPLLIASSASNVVIALLFPTLFAIAAFSYVAWIFPGDGWSFFAAPAQSLSQWAAAVNSSFAGLASRSVVLAAVLQTAAALLTGAPAALWLLWQVRHRRPLIVPAAVFAGSAVTASAVAAGTPLFGDPSPMLAAAPVLAAASAIRIPVAREYAIGLVGLLLFGWAGGLLSVVALDPLALERLHPVAAPDNSERLAALVAGGAARQMDGILVDVDNAPAFLLGRGGARGILAPQTEPFALALMFRRIDAPFVALPDPHSATGAGDRLDIAFPSLFRDGMPDYRLVYQNDTWRIFARTKPDVPPKQ